MNDTERMSAKVLAAIRASIRNHGRPPTLREIGAAIGMASTNGVRYHLARLEAHGLIARDPMITRGIRVLQSRDAE